VKARLLICDLDNTLYDWVGYFVPAFYAMVDEAVRITGCDRDRLLDDFRDVHRVREDSEQPYALLDTQMIRDLFPRRSRSEVSRELASAFDAFNAARDRHLQLYPHVRETLNALRDAGVILAAHTESKLNAVVDRLTRLSITQYFRHIYCRQRTAVDHPERRSTDKTFGGFPMARVRELSHHQRKPDPSVLIEICSKEHISIAETAYVGDSIVRDVYLAKTAGAYAIWAKYGSASGTDEYQKLVRISHWSSDDVAREKMLGVAAQNSRPDYVLEKGFNEILCALDVDAPDGLEQREQV
jgi:FMN phosphatase YigB (HAD superfamily)